MTVKLPTRIALVVAVVGLTLAGAGYANPSWTTGLGLDFWNVPTLKARLARDRSIAADLENRDQQVLQRIAVKETLIEDLVGGRLSLTDTAAIPPLNAGRADYATAIRTMYPDARTTSDSASTLSATSNPTLRPMKTDWPSSTGFGRNWPTSKILVN